MGRVCVSRANGIGASTTEAPARSKGHGPRRSVTTAITSGKWRHASRDACGVSGAKTRGQDKPAGPADVSIASGLVGKVTRWLAMDRASSRRRWLCCRRERQSPGRPIGDCLVGSRHGHVQRAGRLVCRVVVDREPRFCARWLPHQADCFASAAIAADGQAGVGRRIDGAGVMVSLPPRHSQAAGAPWTVIVSGVNPRKSRLNR